MAKWKRYNITAAVLATIGLCMFVQPALELMTAAKLMKSGVVEDAVVLAYMPERGREGKKERLRKDFYLISYGGIENVILHASSKTGHQIEARMPSARILKVGSHLPVLYLPEEPEVVVRAPEKMTLFYIYNASYHAVRLYLLKFIGIMLLSFAPLASFLGKQRADMLAKAEAGSNLNIP